MSLLYRITDVNHPSAEEYKHAVFVFFCTVAASAVADRCVKPIPIIDGGLFWPDILELPAGHAGVKI